MIGAIAGDMIGSPYERDPIKSKDFGIRVAEFTDDTVLTVAVADAVLSGTGFTESIVSYAQRYPDAGYGGTFRLWMWSPDHTPYNSWGNGAAMRVSPVGFAFDTVEEVLTEAKRSAEVSHNHPEGIRGAQAAALAIFLARKFKSKRIIRDEISGRFPYDLERTIDEIRPAYRFDISCQGSVPESIIAFLESVSYEDAIRNAISLGGDADTMACIAGAVAQAFYKEIPADIIRGVREKLPPFLMDVTDRFMETYHCVY